MGKSDKGRKAVTFNCKESGCTESVVYKQKIVFGVTAPADALAGDKVVYLTCSRGHTHPYTVTGD